VVSAGHGLRGDNQPTIFAPNRLAHLPVRTLYVPFRDAAALAGAMPVMRTVFRQIDARVPFTVNTLQQSRVTRSAPRRFMAVAVAVLGAFALILAAAGVYALGAYLVELRRREIGVRMAVGASSSAVLSMMLTDAGRMAAAGSVAGLGLATAAAVVVRSRMYGTAMIDPVAFAGALVVLLLTLLAASALPARRAARVDPAVVLRSDT
jgi:ABC-type antimicrobial peptide transport system permease subunit